MKRLRTYQELPYLRAFERNLLVADDRGLGKTVMSIETAKRIIQERQAPVLVIVPKTLKAQWWEEILDQDEHAIGMELQTSTKLDFVYNSKKPFWVLTHYEAVMKHWRMLSKTQWACIIVDEAHRIKNRKAQRTVAIKKLKAYRKIALTGTPYDKNPADIWSILNWLQPDVFRSYWDFFKAHVNYDGELGSAIEINGVKDGAKFSRAIAPYVIRRSKHDVAPMLPPKIEQHISVEMTPEQASLYQRIKIAAETDATLDDGKTLVMPNLLARILRLQQAAVDPRLLGTDANGAKIDWLLEYADDNPGTLLVFTRFRDTAIRVARLLDAPYYVGGTNLWDLQQYPKIVATIDAAKEGLNLGHIWNTVFMDSHWSSIAMAQAIDRTERDLSATEPRVIMYLNAVDTAHQPTVDALVRQALESKWSTIELVNTWLKRTQQGRDNELLRDVAINDALDMFGF